jgi:hypothetical protein
MYGHGAKLNKLATKIRRFTMSTLILVIKNIGVFVLCTIITITIIGGIVGITVTEGDVGGAMLAGYLSLFGIPTISIISYVVVMSIFFWNRDNTSDAHNKPKPVADENAPYGERI